MRRIGTGDLKGESTNVFVCVGLTLNYLPCTPTNQPTHLMRPPIQAEIIPIKYIRNRETYKLRTLRRHG